MATINKSYNWFMDERMTMIKENMEVTNEIYRLDKVVKFNKKHAIVNAEAEEQLEWNKKLEEENIKILDYYWHAAEGIRFLRMIRNLIKTKQDWNLFFSSQDLVELFGRTIGEYLNESARK